MYSSSSLIFKRSFQTKEMRKKLPLFKDEELSAFAADAHYLFTNLEHN